MLCETLCWLHAFQSALMRRDTHSSEIDNTWNHAKQFWTQPSFSDQRVLKVAPQLSSAIALAARGQLSSSPSGAVLDDMGRLAATSVTLKPWLQSLGVTSNDENALSPWFWNAVVSLMKGHSVLKLKKKRQNENIARKLERMEDTSGRQDAAYETEEFVAELQALLSSKLVALCADFSGHVIHAPALVSSSDERPLFLRSIDVTSCRVLQSRERVPFTLVCEFVASDAEISFVGDVPRGEQSCSSEKRVFCFEDDSQHATLIVKADDDLRQEVLSMQLVALTNELLDKKAPPMPSVADLRRALDGARRAADARKKKGGLFGSKKGTEEEASNPFTFSWPLDVPSEAAAASFDPRCRAAEYGIQVVTPCGGGLIEAVKGSTSIHRLMALASAALSSDIVVEFPQSPSTNVAQQQQPLSASPPPESPASAVTPSAFFRGFLQQLLHPVEAADARARFHGSIVGAAVVSIVLALKDRHNANILVTQGGQMVHVDFGFLLGSAPGGKMLSLEKCAFKLHDEILAELLGGSVKSVEFGAFRDSIVSALWHISFAVPNAYRSALAGVSPILVRTMPCLGTTKDATTVATAALEQRLFFPPFVSAPASDPAAVADFLDRLLEAIEEAGRMVSDCASNKGTKAYDKFQKSSNGIFY